jgi:hypothetical protein
MNNARANTLLIFLSVTAAGNGCSDGGSVDIGSTQVVGSQLSDYAATWDGFAEAFHFWPDGSDRVRLTIDGSGQGTLEIGNSALLAPPTDPNVGYPANIYSGTVGNTSGTGTQIILAEGFLYPIHAATVATNRIQLGVDPNELFAPWCQLQTSYDWTSQTGGYTCVPLPKTENHDPATGLCTENLADGTTVTVDCGKWDECFMSAVCACTSTGCTGNMVPAGSSVSQYFELDGALDSTGTTLTATLGTGGPTVVLTKQ